MNPPHGAETVVGSPQLIESARTHAPATTWGPGAMILPLTRWSATAASSARVTPPSWLSREGVIVESAPIAGEPVTQEPVPHAMPTTAAGPAMIPAPPPEAVPHTAPQPTGR